MTTLTPIDKNKYLYEKAADDFEFLNIEEMRKEIPYYHIDLLTEHLENSEIEDIKKSYRNTNEYEEFSEIVEIEKTLILNPNEIEIYYNTKGEGKGILKSEMLYDGYEKLNNEVLKEGGDSKRVKELIQKVNGIRDWSQENPEKVEELDYVEYKVKVEYSYFDKTFTVDHNRFFFREEIADEFARALEGKNEAIELAATNLWLERDIDDISHDEIIINKVSSFVYNEEIEKGIKLGEQVTSNFVGADEIKDQELAMKIVDDIDWENWSDEEGYFKVESVIWNNLTYFKEYKDEKDIDPDEKERIKSFIDIYLKATGQEVTLDELNINQMEGYFRGLTQTYITLDKYKEVQEATKELREFLNSDLISTNQLNQ